MNFVCVVFELCDKMLTLSSMENLIVPCNLFLYVHCIICTLKQTTLLAGVDVAPPNYAA